MTPNKPTLKQMITWAKQAGNILRQGYGKRHQISLKGATNLVTEMDHRSEAYLIGQIRAHFPDHAILSEESGALAGNAGASWIIDPLDGTTNYAHDVPFFSVSMAFAWQGKVQLGVVYDPMRRECFYAQRGKGAWLNGRPIHVSETAELIKSLLATGFPYEDTGGEKPQTHRNLQYFAAFTLTTQGMRRLGSATLDICYVAAGRLDGFWEMFLGAWDVAASSLIAEEAGAMATDLQGNTDYLKPPYDVVIANPALHPLLCDTLNK